MSTIIWTCSSTNSVKNEIFCQSRLLGHTILFQFWMVSDKMATIWFITDNHWKTKCWWKPNRGLPFENRRHSVFQPTLNSKSRHSVFSFPCQMPGFRVLTVPLSEILSSTIARMSSSIKATASEIKKHFLLSYLQQKNGVLK